MDELNKPEATNDAHVNDFDLEISDLPPTERHHYTLIKLAALFQRLRAALTGSKYAEPPDDAAARLARRKRRGKIGRSLTAVGLCAALLLLLVGNAPALRTRFLGFLTQPASTPTPVPAGLAFSSQRSVPIIVGGRYNIPNRQNQSPLGSLPATCPRASMLQFFLTPFDPLDPLGLGNGPLWITGFVGPTAALMSLQPFGASFAHPPGSIVGWYENLAIFLQKGFPDTIILQGQSQDSGNPVLFASAGSLNFSPTLVLNTQHSSAQQPILDGSWEIISINLFVPDAGCYALQASWPHNTSWLYYFAAGK